MIFVSDHQATKVLQPGKQAFDSPTLSISPQASAILRRGLSPILLMWSDHLNPAFRHQSLIQGIAVVGFVADQMRRQFLQKTRLQRTIHQRYFVRLSTGGVNGERKTASVCKAHNFGAFAFFGFAHTIAPFFAGAKVPSINPSLRSMPPRSRKSSAKAVRILAKTPDRFHSWNRRWQVLRGGYRSGRSAHGAPVRRIQRMPLSTARGLFGGRPDSPGWALGSGIYSAIRCHCSFVRSIGPVSAVYNTDKHIS